MAELPAPPTPTLAAIYAAYEAQQGDGFRILYVHAPSAWMSMFTYVVMAVAAGVGLIWKLAAISSARTIPEWSQPAPPLAEPACPSGPTVLP